MPFNTELITAIALGIALSACSGFRVFVPLLAGSLAGRLDWVALPADMNWISSLPALVCFGVAAVLEIAAYYIPFVDNLLDAIATPLSMAAGTVLAASFLPFGETTPMIKWIAAAITGGGAAGTIHLGTGFLRLLSTKTTGGIGNPIIATTENTAAIGGSLLSFFLPIIIAVLVLMLITWTITRLFRRLRRSSV